VNNLKFGLALSGGGMKGIAHLGVLKALEEYNIYPEIITGTSCGAIIAGLYAYGLTYQEIYDFFINIDYKILDIDYFNILSSIFSLKLPSGIIKGDKLLNLLNNITKKINIKDINKKFAIVSTNLKNGNDMIFTNDINFKNFKDKNFIHDFQLSETIRASMSYPLIFKPFIKNNNIFIDGGIVDNCPASLCQNLGAEFVIISNLSNINENNKNDNALSIISQIINIFVQEAYEDDIVISNINSYMLQLNLSSLKIPLITFNKVKLKEAFNFGYETMKEKIKEFKFNEL